MTTELVPRRICAGLTKNGQPCGAYAAIGTRDFKCVKHTEDPSRTGGGVGIQARTPVCYCGATKDEKGKSTKHKPGVAPCTAAVTRVVRVHGDPAQMPQEGPGLLPEPTANELTFEGMEGPWQMYLGLVATGGRMKQSAAAAGLTVAQVNRRKKTDPAFAEQFELAERLACDAVEDSVFGLATGRYGIPSLDAARWWLANRDAPRWKGDLRSIELKGTVTQEHVFDYASASAEIEALHATLRERAERKLPPAIVARVLDAEGEEPLPAPASGTPWKLAPPTEQGRL